MLSNLDSHDWRHIDAAYNDARLVPYLLKELVSKPDHLVPEIFDELRNLVFHQHSFYESTVLIIPFLINLLDSKSIVLRVKILEFLGDVAKESIQVLEEDNQSDEFREQYIFPCLENVSQGLNYYSRGLDDSNFLVRMMSAYIFAWMSIYRNAELNILLKRLSVEQNSQVTASLIFAIGEITAHLRLEPNAIFSIPLQTSSFPAHYAYIIVLNRHTMKIDSRSVTSLIEIVNNLDRLPRELTVELETSELSIRFQFPWMQYCTKVFFVGFLLEHLNLEQTDTISIFCQLIENDSEYTFDRVSMSILRKYVPLDKNGKLNLEALSSTSKQLLMAVFNNIYIWSNFNGNVQNAFRQLGLPDRRADWILLLEIENTRLPASQEQAEELFLRILSSKQHMSNRHDDYSSITTFSIKHIGSDPIIPFLGKLIRLRSLHLSHGHFSSEGLLQMPVFPHLEELFLVGLRFSEEFAAYLSELINLKKLDMTRTNFRVEWLHYLETLGNLNLLILTGTLVDKDDVIALQRKIPRCRIYV